MPMLGTTEAMGERDLQLSTASQRQWPTGQLQKQAKQGEKTLPPDDPKCGVTIRPCSLVCVRRAHMSKNMMPYTRHKFLKTLVVEQRQSDDSDHSDDSDCQIFVTVFDPFDALCRTTRTCR